MRTRMSGGVGAGRSILPATRFAAFSPSGLRECEGVLIQSNRPVAKIHIISLEDGKPLGVTIQSPISQHDAPSGCDVTSKIVLASVCHRECNEALQGIRVRCGEHGAVNPAARCGELYETLGQDAKPPPKKNFIIEGRGVSAHMVRPTPAKLTSEKEGLAKKCTASFR